MYNMVAFRNVVDGTPVQNWWSGGDFQIAFSRYIRILCIGVLISQPNCIMAALNLPFLNYQKANRAKYCPYKNTQQYCVYVYIH